MVRKCYACTHVVAMIRKILKKIWYCAFFYSISFSFRFFLIVLPDEKIILQSTIYYRSYSTYVFCFRISFVNRHTCETWLERQKIAMTVSTFSFSSRLYQAESNNSLNIQTVPRRYKLKPRCTIAMVWKPLKERRLSFPPVIPEVTLLSLPSSTRSGPCRRTRLPSNVKRRRVRMVNGCYAMCCIESQSSRLMLSIHCLS